MALENGYAETCWAALMSDTNSPMAVVCADGMIVYANDVVTRAYAVNGSPIGKRLHDMMPAECAEERLSYIRQVISTGKPVVIDGILNGQLRRSTMRPLPPDAQGRSRVLATCRRLSEADYTQGRVAGVVRAKHDDLGQLESLTQREMEILQLIGQGLSTADIAKRLHRSVKTIEWHRVSLGTKLGVTNRVELARIAIHAGVVPLAETKANPDTE